MSDKCDWKLVYVLQSVFIDRDAEYTYKTGCIDKLRCEGNVELNNYKFCPYCGQEIEVKND